MFFDLKSIFSYVEFWSYNNSNILRNLWITLYRISDVKSRETRVCNNKGICHSPIFSPFVAYSVVGMLNTGLWHYYRPLYPCYFTTNPIYYQLPHRKCFLVTYFIDFVHIAHLWMVSSLRLQRSGDITICSCDVHDKTTCHVYVDWRWIFVEMGILIEKVLARKIEPEIESIEHKKLPNDL